MLQQEGLQGAILMSKSAIVHSLACMASGTHIAAVRLSYQNFFGVHLEPLQLTEGSRRPPRYEKPQAGAVMTVKSAASWLMTSLRESTLSQLIGSKLAGPVNPDFGLVTLSLWRQQRDRLHDHKSDRKLYRQR